MADIKEGKYGADMTGVCQEMYGLFPIIDDAWADHGWEEPVITEGRREPTSEDFKKIREGKKPSFHIFGQAIDIRANYMSDEQQDEQTHDLQVRVGPLYQVVSEHFNDPTNNHIHVEAETSVTYPEAKIWYQSNKAKYRKE